jgi:hypothetical protein
LDVRKNRFDGTLGSIPLKYSPPTNCFVAPTAEEIENERARIEDERMSQYSYASAKKKGGRPAALKPAPQPAVVVDSVAESSVSEEDAKVADTVSGKAKKSSKSASTTSGKEKAEVKTMPKKRTLTDIGAVEAQRDAEEAKAKLAAAKKVAAVDVSVNSVEESGPAAATDATATGELTKENVLKWREEATSWSEIARRTNTSEYKLKKWRKDNGFTA